MRSIKIHLKHGTLSSTSCHGSQLLEVVESFLKSARGLLSYHKFLFLLPHFIFQLFASLLSLLLLSFQTLNNIFIMFLLHRAKRLVLVMQLKKLISINLVCFNHFPQILRFALELMQSFSEAFTIIHFVRIRAIEIFLLPT